MAESLIAYNPTGEYVSPTIYTKNIEHNHFTEIATVTLEKGVWAIVAGLEFQQNLTGYRLGQLSDTALTSPTRFCITTTPVSGTDTNVNIVNLFSLDNTTIVRLYAQQTSGQTLYVVPYIKAVRIK